ncbi:MAG: dinitrogenase iron-molybdenum cofactor biosynthesis protein [Anaerolineae bacterium]|nr:dinitrogenase iron-molybdenum cofactor biosynthesis protein [Anaerolineae bacterium]
MKIAVITDDGTTISQHFGRAQHYMVCTVQDGQIIERELRDKMGHRQFVTESHEHNHETSADARGHGFGAEADRKHGHMIDAITDCEALLVRGMGRGAYLALQQANITPIVTDIPTIDDAVMAYVNGEITDRTDRLH